MRVFDRCSSSGLLHRFGIECSGLDQGYLVLVLDGKPLTNGSTTDLDIPGWIELHREGLGDAFYRCMESKFISRLRGG